MHVCVLVVSYPTAALLQRLGIDGDVLHVLFQHTHMFCCRRDRAATARKALSQKGGRPTSTYRGVTHHIRTGRWEAHVWLDGKQASARGERELVYV